MYIVWCLFQFKKIEKVVVIILHDLAYSLLMYFYFARFKEWIITISSHFKVSIWVPGIHGLSDPATGLSVVSCWAQVSKTIFCNSLKAYITPDYASYNLCPFIGFFLASPAFNIPTFQANTSYVSKKLSLLLRLRYPSVKKVFLGNVWAQNSWKNILVLKDQPMLYHNLSRSACQKVLMI